MTNQQTIYGEGVGRWPLSPKYARNKTMDGTILLFTGTGSGDYNVLGITDNRTEDGKITNSDTGAQSPEEDDYYLTSFYNEDANTGTGAAATQKDISVGIYVPPGSDCQIRNLRVMLSFNGNPTTE